MKVPSNVNAGLVHWCALTEWSNMRPNMVAPVPELRVLCMGDMRSLASYVANAFFRNMSTMASPS